MKSLLNCSDDNVEKEGVLVVGKIKKDKPSISRPLSNDEEWQFYEMPPNEFMPKDS